MLAKGKATTHQRSQYGMAGDIGNGFARQLGQLAKGRVLMAAVAAQWSLISLSVLHSVFFGC